MRLQMSRFAGDVRRPEKNNKQTNTHILNPQSVSHISTSGNWTKWPPVGFSLNCFFFFFLITAPCESWIRNNFPCRNTISYHPFKKLLFEALDGGMFWGF